MLNGTESPERRTMERKAWKIQLRERLLKFSISVITLANQLPKSAAGFAIANQVIRSGTSIGANNEEAQDASSLKDFIQKLSISLREARETLYWLEVTKGSHLIEGSQIDSCMDECNELISIFVRSIKSSKDKVI